MAAAMAWAAACLEASAWTEGPLGDAAGSAVWPEAGPATVLPAEPEGCGNCGRILGGFRQGWLLEFF